MKSELYINGEWVPGRSGEWLDVVDPASNSVFHRVSIGIADDVDTAVSAAREAFDHGHWRMLSGSERATMLRLIAEYIRDNASELARLEVRDNGKPLAEAEWDIGDTADCFSYYADLAQQLDSDARSIDVPMAGFQSKVVREPVGVVGAIIPWNFPMLMAAWKVAPALAAGCTLVLKPSEYTPLTALELGAASDAVGLPKGVLNVVNGLGSVAGQAIVAHPQVDKIAFTGSVPTGTKVMAAAAEDIKNVTLELGGKSALIIFEDTPVDEAVEWIMNGAFWNKGEVCTATSRVLIQQALYELVVDRLRTEAQRIKIGSGFEDGVLLGPLVNEVQHGKVLSAIEKGINEGAKLICGGNVPNGLEAGCFIQPTVFADAPLDGHVWNEEIFGPVVCVHPFNDESESIRLANNSRFGLAAAVMSTDVERAERVAGQLRAGIVWINCSQPTFVQAPWGGYKQSGVGRELGEWGLDNYLETKQITSYDRREPWGWYIK